jgi:soluble lytic murein transglycosylase-like protein
MTSGRVISLFLLLALIVFYQLAWTASGEIYSYVDQNGVIHLANRPKGKIIPLKRNSSGGYQAHNPIPSRRYISSYDKNRYDQYISSASRQYNVGFELIKAVIHAESAFNPRAVSHKGARGLMQLMPGTASYLGVKNSFDPQENIFGGTRYLREMLDRYDHDLRLSLAAYNAGPEAVDRTRGVPPYEETHNYIRQVSGLMRIYGSVASSGGRIYRVVKDGRVLLTNKPLP